MFGWWGRAVVRLRWVVLVTAAIFVVAGAAWGSGVFGSLTGGGFDDPASESSRAHERITAELGEQGADVLVLYSAETATVDQPQVREAVVDTLRRVGERPEVAEVVSWYDTQAPALVSADRHATYALIRLRADGEDGKRGAFEELRPALAAPGVRTEVGGTIPFLTAASDQTRSDIVRAEVIAMPILLVLLVVVFGGLVAAATPLLIGGLAIIGGLVAIRLINNVTDVSVFAVNIITLLGLGMAVDYALFVVSRFREELAAGRDVPAAVGHTVATAGRTVLVSGLTIALALASLLLFPQAFLRSLGLGGVAAVLFAMVAAVTALPALLAVLGDRINALRVPLPARWRRRVGGHPEPRRDAPADRAGAVSGGWARLAHSVMRRPVPYVVGVVAVLAVLAGPFVRADFGGFDERVLPPGSEVRAVSERIGRDFPAGTSAPVQVFVSGEHSASARLVAEIRELPDVVDARVTASRGQAALIEVAYPGEPTGDTASEVVRAIRQLPDPPGAQVLVGGRPAVDLDQLDSLADRLPVMALIMAASTLVLLFLAFGSVVLPVKAVLMNLVSIGASFGVVVLVFQYSWAEELLGFTSTGFLEASNLILMLAVLFGLATDYEVFLLSRVREEWDATGDNTAAVAAGLQRTGRIITAAALLLIVVVAGFVAGGIAVMKLIGVGMMVAILVDATLVRALLVPATMRLLGRWNWWAPGPLARVYRRYGLRESDPAPAGEPRVGDRVGTAR